MQLLKYMRAFPLYCQRFIMIFFKVCRSDSMLSVVHISLVKLHIFLCVPSTFKFNFSLHKEVL